jgi:hypothetical protein
MADSILIAKNSEFSSYIVPQMVNLQGLIAGPTGTVKTVTFQSGAERFLILGMPVNKMDIKSHSFIKSNIADGNKKVDAQPLLLGRVLGKCKYAKRH